MTIKSLSPDWNDLLKSEFDKDYFKQLSEQINLAYKTKLVYPPAKLVFNAFNLCPFNSIKVVLIGQDPYHGDGQANGLCFSVNDGIRQPPSLKNIFKELKTDIPEFEEPISGNLEAWAKQGVLMLNAVLTVEAALPGSHKVFGWELFTDSVIKFINDGKEKVVFLLWGNYAIGKALLINAQKHLVLKAAHPSPLARGAFFGSKHFSKTNAYLKEQGLEEINWTL
jgi:uracil-DNA glycosylase